MDNLETNREAGSGRVVDLAMQALIRQLLLHLEKSGSLLLITAHCRVPAPARSPMVELTQLTTKIIIPDTINQDVDKRKTIRLTTNHPVRGLSRN